MRNFVLLLFFAIVSLSPIDLTGFNDEGDYPATIPAPFVTGFYAFSVEKNGSYDITLQAGTATGQISIGVGFGACGGMEMFAGSVENDFTLMENLCLTGGNVYYILLALEEANAGSFTITIDGDPIDNDDCANAEVVTGSNSYEGTNKCAGLDFVDYCNIDGNSHDVWYKYTSPDNTVNLIVTVNGNTATTGTAATQASLLALTDCGGTVLQGYPDGICDVIGQDVEISCIPPNTTIYIAVASTDGADGDFTISFEQKDVVTVDNNNVCEEARELIYSEDRYCNVQTYEGNNEGACPENFLVGDCDLTQAPTVWYKVEIPEGAANLDVSITEASFDDVTLVVKKQCDATEGYCAANMGNDPASFDPAILIDPALWGTAVYIAVSGGVDEQGGKYNINIKMEVPPKNDSPCQNVDNPEYGPHHFDAAGGSHDGTTCCAIGYADDNSLDYPNVDCNTATEENAVWYTYSPPDNVDGIEIEVTGGTIQGNTTIEVFKGPVDMGCSGVISGFVASECGALESPTKIKIPICDDENGGDDNIYWIKVASADDDCGTFNISVKEAKLDCNRPAKKCEDVEMATFNLETDENYEEIYQQCEDFCLDLACPDQNAKDLSGCSEYADSPTVWIKIKTDAIPSKLVTSVAPAGTWDPIWTVFAGEDCDNLKPVANSQDPPSNCNDQTATTAITIDDAGDPIQTYYIAITADPNGAPIDDPGFEFCAYTRIEVLTCIGPEGGCDENDPTTKIEVTWRDSGADLDDLQFCPGEEVKIKMSFYYDASESAQDWFMGFIPDFGPGWDLANFDWTASLPVGNGSPGGFYSPDGVGGQCEWTIHRTFPHLCTYTDSDGVLRLVHTECDEGGLCVNGTGMSNGDLLPPGYAWPAPNQSSGCDLSVCDPRNHWGIGSRTASVEWEFNIKVKEFEDPNDCASNENLQIRFICFSDDGAGCYADSKPCRLDKLQKGPEWTINCNVLPKPIVEDDEICSGEQVDVDVSVENGVTKTVQITYIGDENGNVTGGNDVTFPAGAGTISDVLTITDPDICEPQIAVYEVQVVPDPGQKICKSKKDSIEVTVYPLPKLVVNIDDGICQEDLPYTVQLEGDCGYSEGGYTFQWKEDNFGHSGTGAQIEIAQGAAAGVYDYNVTVTDGFGCKKVESFSFEVYPDVQFDLEGATICWGHEHLFEPENVVGGGNYDYSWYWNSGSNNPVDIGNSRDYHITEYDFKQGNIEKGTWELCLEISEDHGSVTCTTKKCVDVMFRPEFKVKLKPENPKVCGTDDWITVELVFEEGGYDENDPNIVIEWTIADGSTGYGSLFDIQGEKYGNVVKVIDQLADDCEYEIEFDVELFEATDLEIEGDLTICEGDNTTLTVKGDFVGYDWSNGEKTESITVSPTEETTYGVVAKNASGCTSNGSVTVKVFKAEIPVLDTVSFCSGYSVTVSAPGTYASYAWYKDAIVPPAISTGNELVINTQGDYILVVTTEEGCEARAPFYAKEDSELSPAVVGDTLLCFGQDETQIIAIGGNFIEYTWKYNDQNGAEVPNTTNKDTVNLEPGSYYLYVSDGSCSGSTTFTIRQKEQIAFPDTTLRVCYKDSVDLIAPAGYESYSWGNSFNDTLYAGKGTYIVTVTDDDECIGTKKFVVEQNDKVVPDLGSDTQICADQKITLNPSKPGETFAAYKWYKDGVEVSSEATIQISETGEYVVVVYDDLNCEGRDTINVTKTEQLEPQIEGIEDLCDDQKITISCPGTYEKYTWTDSDGNILSEEQSFEFTMKAGRDVETITLTVESGPGCTGEAPATINRYNSPELAIDDDEKEACGNPSTNGGTTLDFSQYFDTSGGKANHTQGVWDDLDGSGVNHNADWTSVDFSNVAAGSTYRFKFTTNYATFPCTDVEDILLVKVIECNCTPWAIDNIQDVCNDANAASIDLDNYINIQPKPTGSWSVATGDASVLTGSTFNPANVKSQTYVLKYTLSEQGNYCDESQEVNITVQNAVSPGEPLPAFTCEGTDVLYRLDSLLLGEDAGGVWSETSDVPSTGSAFDAVAGTFSTAGQIAGTYTFKYALDGVAPCPDADVTVTVIIQPIPVADPGVDVDICFEEKPVTLGSAQQAFAYRWTLTGSDLVLSTERYFEVTESGVYQLKVETEAGCFDTKEVEVIIRPDILVDIEGEFLLQDGDSTILQAVVDGRNTDEIRLYNWTLNGVEIAGQHQSELSVSDAGEYCVTVEDVNGCLGNACVTVNTVITKIIDIPNIFTPDDDGNNDEFFIRDGKNVKHINSLRIFDRWGELVYSSSDFTFEDRLNHSWNGEFRGEKAMQGVYIYVVDLTWSDDKSEVVAGDVTLIR